MTRCSGFEAESSSVKWKISGLYKCVGFEKNQDGAFVMAIATSGNMVLFRRYCCVRIYKCSL